MHVRSPVAESHSSSEANAGLLRLGPRRTAWLEGPEMMPNFPSATRERERERLSERERERERASHHGIRAQKP